MTAETVFGLDDGFWEALGEMSPELGDAYDLASKGAATSPMLSYGARKPTTTIQQQMGKLMPATNPMLPGGLPMAPSGYRSLFGTPFEGFRGR
jgi:hypothetical protein